MRRSVGRPRKYNGRRNAYCLKLNDKEDDMLADLREDLSMSTQDVFRYLLHNYYSDHYYSKDYTSLRRN